MKFAALPAVLTIVAVCAVALPAPRTLAQSTGKELIAVLDLKGVGTSEVEAVAISDRLREVLLKTGRFKLINRSQMEAILNEQALQQTTCTDQNCAVQVGRILGVRKIVTGKITKIPGQLWQVSAVMLNVETAETLKADSIRHQGDFFTLLENQLPLLGAKLASVPAPATPSAPAAVPAPPPATPSLPVVGLAGKWQAKAPMPTFRHGHASVAIGHRIFVFGGIGKNSQPLASVEVYDARADTWQALPPLPSPRSAASVAAYGGRIYLMGGKRGKETLARVDIFDPGSATWAVGPALPTPRAGAVGNVAGGRLYVAGGVDGEGAYLAQVLTLASSGAGWQPIAQMNRARAYATSEVLAGRLYVFGGRSQSRGMFRATVLLKSAEVYDVAGNQWAELPDMPIGGSHLSSAVIQRKIYVFGGYGGNFAMQSPSGWYRVFDSTTHDWEQKGKMPKGRAAHTSTVAGGKIYFIGGLPKQGRDVIELR